MRDPYAALLQSPQDLDPAVVDDLDDGTFLFESGLVDFGPRRVIVPGPRSRPFPPRFARPGSVADEDYSPLVTAGGVTYDAPIVAAAVEDASISFPDGNPNYDLVHDQVVAIDPAQRTVTLNLINGFSFGKPVFYISSDASDPRWPPSRRTRLPRACSGSKSESTTSREARWSGSSSR